MNYLRGLEENGDGEEIGRFVKINDGPMRLKEYLWGCKIYVTLYFITAKGKKGIVILPV